MSKLDVFYTGGGIWIAEMNLEDNKYGVVNSEAPEYFGIYEYEQAEDGNYYPEDMILDKHKDELDDELKKVYEKLLIALAKRNGWGFFPRPLFYFSVELFWESDKMKLYRFTKYYLYFILSWTGKTLDIMSRVFFVNIKLFNL